MAPPPNHCMLAGWLADWSSAWLAERLAGWLPAPCPHAERARLVAVCVELCGAEQITAGLSEGFAKSSSSAVHDILAPSHVANESIWKVVILSSSKFVLF